MGKWWLGLAVVFLASGARAADCSGNRGHELSFPKGKKVRVVGYDKSSRTYTIQSYNFPGEGNWKVLPESLRESIPSLNSIDSVLKSKPDDIVDEVYITEKDIPTMFESEVSARVECLSKPPKN